MGGDLCLGEGVSVQGRGFLSRGVSVWGVSVQGAGSLFRVSLSGGSLSRGVSVQGVSLSGWYTSYWNAFLFLPIIALGGTERKGGMKSVLATRKHSYDN